jgi:hypothetical protein
VTSVEVPLRAFTAPSSETLAKLARPLLIAGAASISAGAIHAAAIGTHAEHPQAARAFAVVALVQLAWGAAALARPSRKLALIGALVSGVFFISWVAAKMRGLPFIDGLGDKEPVQWADGLAAAFALIATLAAAKVALWTRPTKPRPLIAAASAGVLLAAALPGMIQAGSHVHSHGHEASAQSVVVGADGKAQLVDAAAAVPAKPFDPTQPIDLGGVTGVTPEQQARAENLVAVTLVRLPQWSDPAVAEAAGFYTIGDGATGFEHLINWEYIDDGKILDPDHPEALVYATSSGKRVLESAMYMLPPGSTLDTVPDVGGALTQWHIHDNLCFTNDPVSPHVAGLTNGNGECRAPLVKLEPVPMIHVWIVSKPCGPFAALEGVGAGQVKPGEAHACDHVHGSNGSGGL